jgi:hypothetical protein
MVNRVAIISPVSQELGLLKAQLKNPLRWVVRDITSMDLLATELSSGPLDVLIVRFAQFGRSQFDKLKKIAARFPKAAIVASSPDIDPVARYELGEWTKRVPHRLRLLLEPMELGDIAAIVEKMLVNDLSFQRMHTRKRREDEAELVDSAGERFKARFLDFSQMGARVQVQSQALAKKRLVRNQRISLRYRSSADPTRTHHIEAIVVWEGPGAGVMESLVFGHSQTVGLRFLAFT